jgi:alpha-L-fucosidase
MIKASLILLTLLFTLAAFAAPPETKAEKDARMKWWKEARFGLFLHWGTYAVPAGEWDGKTNYGEWIREEAHIPIDQYNKFAQEFNPVKFDAEKWVTAAANAGMKYIVITSKHHEGFNMFASKYTDYNIMNTPFKRDPMKELAAACARHGITFCFYHSIMDWHDFNYLPRRSWEDRPAAGADFDKFNQYLQNDVKQLLTDYGPIGVMWFDGEWESTWNHEYGQALYDLCRQTQPNVIVNNRVDVGRSGLAGMSTTEGTAGDYGTPEQEIPAQGMPGTYWETCMTMNDHWGYNKNDHDYKTTPDLIHTLVDIASKGGNFLLNIGPTAEGEFPAEALDRLSGIGAWMKVNGDAIYATDASPFADLKWGRCTQRQDGDTTTLYLEVFDWPADGKLVVPGLGNTPIAARTMAEPSRELSVQRHDGDLTINVPAKAPDAICSVIALTIQSKPIVYKAPEIDSPTTLVYGAVHTTIDSGSPELEVHYTLDGKDPSVTSPRYERPLVITGPTDLKARSFHNGKPVSPVTEKKFTSATLQMSIAGPANPGPGLHYEYFAGNFEKVADLDASRSVSSGPTTGVNLDLWPKTEHFGAILTGFINVPEDGVYEFELTSDDGSTLTIGDRLVVDNDGLHSPSAKTGEIALSKGLHALKIAYFNGGGGQALGLRWSLAGRPWESVDSDTVVH